MQRKSFFERLIGNSNGDNEILDDAPIESDDSLISIMDNEEDAGGELSVDVFQTSDEIVIRAMIAGVKPDDLDVNITRSMVTIKGKREEGREVKDRDFFFKELYWGSFSRTISLPEEIEVEDAEATEKYGVLTIKLPKIDRAKQNKLKVKSSSEK
jgi:HSP20 family protein